MNIKDSIWIGSFCFVAVTSGLTAMEKEKVSPKVIPEVTALSVGDGTTMPARLESSRGDPMPVKLLPSLEQVSLAFRPLGIILQGKDPELALVFLEAMSKGGVLFDNEELVNEIFNMNDALLSKQFFEMLYQQYHQGSKKHPLYWAVKYKSFDNAVVILKKMVAQYQLPPDKEVTDMIIALGNSQLLEELFLLQTESDGIERILKKGINVSYVDAEGQTLLHRIARRVQGRTMSELDETLIVVLCLKNHGIDVDRRDNRGNLYWSWNHNLVVALEEVDEKGNT